MRILLTGASGFLGQNILPKLKEDYYVYGISSKAKKTI
jgi:nucleoside-diphosphate-sugar epimerase